MSLSPTELHEFNPPGKTKACLNCSLVLKQTSSSQIVKRLSVLLASFSFLSFVLFQRHNATSAESELGDLIITSIDPHLCAAQHSCYSSAIVLAAYKTRRRTVGGEHLWGRSRSSSHTSFFASLLICPRRTFKERQGDCTASSSPLSPPKPLSFGLGALPRFGARDLRGAYSVPHVS